MDVRVVAPTEQLEAVLMVTAIRDAIRPDRDRRDVMNLRRPTFARPDRTAIPGRSRRLSRDRPVVIPKPHRRAHLVVGPVGLAPRAPHAIAARQ